jgi:hypothetical protein
MYLKESRGAQKPDNGFLIGSTNSWFEESVPPDRRKQELAKIIEEGELGDAQLTKTISQGVSLSAVLPNIYGVLELDPGVDLTHGVDVTLTATSASNRRLNWTQLQQAINSGMINASTKKHLADRDVVIGAADIVLGGYAATVKLNDKSDAKLKAALSNNVGKVLGKGAGLNLQITGGENGTYQITSKQPVIAAVLYLDPPAQRPRGRAAGGEVDLGDLYNWKKVTLDPAKTREVELEAELGKK